MFTKKKYFLLCIICIICIKTIIFTDGWASLVELKYFMQLNGLVGGDQGEMPGESSVHHQPVRQLLQQGGGLNRLGEGVLTQLLARKYFQAPTLPGPKLLNKLQLKKVTMMELYVYDDSSSSSSSSFTTLTITDSSNSS